jgi:hypothetical protein
MSFSGGRRPRPAFSGNVFGDKRFFTFVAGVTAQRIAAGRPYFTDAEFERIERVAARLLTSDDSPGLIDWAVLWVRAKRRQIDEARALGIDEVQQYRDEVAGERERHRIANLPPPFETKTSRSSTGRQRVTG